MASSLVLEAVSQAQELLQKNIVNGLLTAALPTEPAQKKHYTHLFARDLGVCSLGLLLDGNDCFTNSVRQSLLVLGQKQAKTGQIPNHLDPISKKEYFYYLGCLDATLWWLLAIAFYDRLAGDQLKKKLQAKIKKAFRWLFSQDQNQDGLLEQGEASDWADVMPYNGAVFYTNVLWYWALRQYHFKAEAALALAGLNTIFSPFTASKNLYLKHNPYGQKIIKFLRASLEPSPYYLPYVSFKYSVFRCDVYANILAVLLGIAPPQKSKEIINFLLKQKISQPYPVRVLTPPIKRGDIDWRPYLAKNGNQPFNYHNGGIWPFVGGFWIAALHKAGYKKLACQELERLAFVNQLNNWQFNEWLDGQGGQPQGMAGQSWNAGSFLFAYYYLHKKGICLI